MDLEAGGLKSARDLSVSSDGEAARRAAREWIDGATRLLEQN